MTELARADSALAALAALARSQFGLFARAQAHELGFSDSWLLRRVRSGLLIREYSAVFRFAAVPATLQQRLMAECLRAPGMVWASHRGAGSFWSLDDVPPVVEVTSLVDIRTDRPDVIIHRTREMPQRDVAIVQGLTVTTVHRTLIDLGAVVDRDTVEVALECALRRRITTIDRLRRRLEAVGACGRRGGGVMKKILDEREPGAPPTGSALEVRFIQLLRRNRIPLPVRQRVVTDDLGFVARVDFEYVLVEVVIEVDSRDHHLRMAEWEHDLRRRNRLTRTGKRVLHVTYERMKSDEAGVVEDIRTALGLSR